MPESKHVRFEIEKARLARAGLPAQSFGMKRHPALVALNLAAAILFGLFSWLQWNDIDPAIYDHPSRLDAVTWLLFYALIAVLFVVVLIRRLPFWLLAAAAVFCLIEMGRTAPGIWENLTGEKEFTMTQASMSASDPRVEQSREFFGAVIALAGVGLLGWERRRLWRSGAGS